MRPYFNIRDELTVDGGLIYKGTRIVIPRALRQSMLTKAHGGHVRMEGCIRRLKEAFFWPGMIDDATAFIGNCETGLSVQDLPRKEPLLPHSFVMHPWAKMAADICKLDGCFLLVVVDYFGNFIEVSRLRTISSNAVIHDLSEIWARWETPETLITDNGRHFDSSEFKAFSKEWCFQHLTSSARWKMRLEPSSDSSLSARSPVRVNF